MSWPTETVIVEGVCYFEWNFGKRSAESELMHLAFIQALHLLSLPCYQWVPGTVPWSPFICSLFSHLANLLFIYISSSLAQGHLGQLTLFSLGFFNVQLWCCIESLSIYSWHHCICLFTVVARGTFFLLWNSHPTHILMWFTATTKTVNDRWKDIIIIQLMGLDNC